MGETELQATITPVGEALLVSIRGVIDEAAAHTTLVPDTTKLVVFDFDDVRRITSFGVLHWRKAITGLKSPRYAFVRCRPSVVRQLNMVSGFGGRAEVHSLYAPFFCERCDLEFQNLIETAGTPRSELDEQLHAAPCPKCGEQAELDEEPSGYLAFLQEYPPAVDDSRIRSLRLSMQMRDLNQDLHAASASFKRSTRDGDGG